MQPIAKLKNKSTSWSAQLRPRVMDVVLFNGSYYQNTSGMNASPTDTNHWFPLPTTLTLVDIFKSATDVEGEDPDFTIDLSSDGMPDFPVSMKVYVKIDNSSPFAEVSPVIYDQDAKVLHSMNNPADFPEMMIRIKAM